MEVVMHNSYAGFLRRFIAFFIDTVVLRVLLAVVFGHFSDLDMYEMKNLFNTNTIVIELVMMAYFVLCESSNWQATVGKRLLGLKVVDSSFGKVSASTAVIRYFSKYISGLVFALGFIWVIFDDRKQGWHDMIAKTFVIRS